MFFSMVFVDFSLVFACFSLVFVICPCSSMFLFRLVVYIGLIQGWFRVSLGFL